MEAIIMDIGITIKCLCREDLSIRLEICMRAKWMKIKQMEKEKCVTMNKELSFKEIFKMIKDMGKAF